MYATHKPTNQRRMFRNTLSPPLGVSWADVRQKVFLAGGWSWLSAEAFPVTHLEHGLSRWLSFANRKSRAGVKRSAQMKGWYLLGEGCARHPEARPCLRRALPLSSTAWLPSAAVQIPRMGTVPASQQEGCLNHLMRKTKIKALENMN